MNEPRTFLCSICGDPSTQICVYCTKDTCANHLCRKCGRCSDCCECEVPLDAEREDAPVAVEPVPAEPEPEAIVPPVDVPATPEPPAAPPEVPPQES